MLIKWLNSFRYAITGLIDLLRTQANARIQLVAALFAMLLGYFFKVSESEWIAIVLCIALVLASEAFNTALEYLTDLLSPELHPLAGKAKDCSAAAVLIIACSSAVVGCMIFLPKITDWLATR